MGSTNDLAPRQLACHFPALGKCRQHRGSLRDREIVWRGDSNTCSVQGRDKNVADIKCAYASTGLRNSRVNECAWSLPHLCHWPSPEKVGMGSMNDGRHAGKRARPFKASSKCIQYQAF